MKPIVITVDEQGKTSLTPEQLQTLIDDAYREGYADGYRSVVIVTPTTTPTYPPYTPPYYTSPIVTCESGEDKRGLGLDG